MSIYLEEQWKVLQVFSVEPVRDFSQIEDLETQRERHSLGNVVKMRCVKEEDFLRRGCWTSRKQKLAGNSKHSTEYLYKEEIQEKVRNLGGEVFSHI